jgi:hypothetical protein
LKKSLAGDGFGEKKNYRRDRTGSRLALMEVGMGAEVDAATSALLARIAHRWGCIRPYLPRLSLLMIRAGWPTLAEVQLADLSFRLCSMATANRSKTAKGPTAVHPVELLHAACLAVHA